MNEMIVCAKHIELMWAILLFIKSSDYEQNPCESPIKFVALLAHSPTKFVASIAPSIKPRVY